VFVSFDLMLVPNPLLVKSLQLWLINFECIYVLFFHFFLSEFGISSSFLEEPNCSLDHLIIRHHGALSQLDNLTVTTL